MTQTTNYSLNIVEGEDLVNPLVQQNPNYEIIDEIMKANQDNSVSPANCTFANNSFVVTRDKPDSNMFRFSAPANFAAGNMFTVDGTQYTPTDSSGSMLFPGSFKAGSNVLCCLANERLTIFAGGSGGNGENPDLSAYMLTSNYVGSGALGVVNAATNAVTAQSAQTATTATSATSAANGENVYTEVKTGTVHALTGQGTQGRFIATSNYAVGDTFSINGTAYNIVTNNGKELPENFFVVGGGIRFFLGNGNIYFF